MKLDFDSIKKIAGDKLPDLDEDTIKKVSDFAGELIKKGTEKSDVIVKAAKKFNIPESIVKGILDKIKD